MELGQVRFACYYYRALADLAQFLNVAMGFDWILHTGRDKNFILLGRRGKEVLATMYLGRMIQNNGMASPQ